MNKDEMNDDAAFEAFLNGEGDLARRLQGLAQPSPSPSLDAAILGRIRTSMEQQRDVAANDAGEAQTGARVAPVMGMRWRVPVGIAASVLVGLFATQAYQSNTSRELVTMRDQERAADAVLEEELAPVPARPAPPAAAPAAALEQAPAMPEERKPAPEPAAPPPPPDMPAKRARAAELEKPRSVKPGLERRAESPVAPPVVSAADVAMSPAPPPAAPTMPAPVSAAPAAKSRSAAPAPQAMQEVTVTGSRIPSRVAESYSPVQVLSDRVEVSGSRIRSSSAADRANDAAAWVQAIEQMLDKADVAGALREWKKLRETYPDFVAPAPLEARMKRLVELND